MNKLKILIALISITGLYSCEENENENTSINKSWPIEEGNYWTFIDSSFYSETPRVDTVTWIVTGKITINEKEYFSISITNDYPTFTNETKWLYCYNDNDVISAGAITPNDTLIAESTLIKDTEIVGDTWTYFHIVNSEANGLYIRDTLEMNLNSIAELTNAKFGLLKYKSYSFSFYIEEDLRVSTFYISENIGPIRITSQENGEIISKSELIDYKVK